MYICLAVVHISRRDARHGLLSWAEISGELSPTAPRVFAHPSYPASVGMGHSSPAPIISAAGKNDLLDNSI